MFSSKTHVINDDFKKTTFLIDIIFFLGKIEKEQVEYYSVAEETRLGPGEKLFDFLAECIADFVQKNLDKDHPNMPLGFTFSFPMEQTGLDKGVLVSWTKSFNAAGKANLI